MEKNKSKIIVGNVLRFLVKNLVRLDIAAWNVSGFSLKDVVIFNIVFAILQRC